MEAAANNGVSVRWKHVLIYEHAIRKKAVELIKSDKITLKEAIRRAANHEGTRALYFTANITLQNRGTKRNIDHVDEGPADSTSSGPMGKGKGKNKGKGKGKGKEKAGYGKNGGKVNTKGGLKVCSRTPDNRMVCYKWNDGLECDGTCQMLHVCRVLNCYDPKHRMINHPGYKK